MLNFTNRGGCIIISKENPRNIAVIYNNYGKLFSFPKGHLEKGETIEECALREVSEETGLSVKIIEPLKEFTCASIYDPKDIAKVFFFLADSLDDNINRSLKIENHINLLWVDYIEVLNLDLAPSFKEFYKNNYKKIENYINQKNF